MKRSIFFGALICAILAVFASCSDPAGGTEPTYIGTKKPSSAKEVGDIVFNDGSATPYAEIIARTEDDSETGAKITKAEKDAAIAVIFYVGTDCSNNGESRTLGVGLKHKQNAWCRKTSDTDKAEAYSTNITTIQCPASGSDGALTFTGDKDGSDNLEQIAKFLKDADGVNDDTATSTNYPAFYFAKNYSTEAINLGTYSAGWYLPTNAELFAIYKVKATVNAASELCGGSKFGASSYWSSCQDDSTDGNACYLAFNIGRCIGFYKSRENFWACAVRAFN